MKKLLNTLYVTTEDSYLALEGENVLVLKGEETMLRLVAKKCVDYGQRVQNLVFECVLDAAQLKRLQHELTGLIDPTCDSLRFYNLGNRYESRVEHVGAKPSYEAEGTLIV